MDSRSLQSFMTGQALQTMTSNITASQTDNRSAFGNIFLQMLKQQLKLNQNNAVYPQQAKMNPSPSSNYTKPEVPLFIKEKLDISVPDKALHGDSKREAGELNSYINQAANKYNVDPDLVHSVIDTESSYNPNATSQAGAQDLMQLMPLNPKSLGITDPYNPEQILRAEQNI